MIKHFVNLTNGIEAMPQLTDDDINFLRIQSTTLENKNWYKLFADLDNNFLMWLAIGAECRVYDFGTNRPKSKTIYMGLPIIEYCLNKYWFGYEMPKVMIGRKCPTNNKAFVEREIYKKYFEYHSERFLDAKVSLSAKYKYFRKFIGSNSRVNLIGISSATCHDSDITYYREVLHLVLYPARLRLVA